LCPSAIAKKILPFQLLSPVKEVSSHLERSYTSPIKHEIKSKVVLII
jgi:hypothetical protein